MRFVEISIPTGKREAVLGVLDDEGIDYSLNEDTGRREYTATVSFPLPTTAVEPVLDKLRESGLPDDANTVILEAESVISRRFSTLEARYATDETTPSIRISRTELKSRVNSLVPSLQTYILMVIASVTVATAGVLLDSAAVVVGSMVIAPLIGPAMATSTGSVLEDRDLFVTGTKFQIIGAVTAILTATAFAFLVKSIYLVPPGTDIIGIQQVQERLEPDFLSLAVALGAGLAGAISLSTGVSAALVGVMIAVALVPPIAVIGIGIAWGMPEIVLDSTVLVLLNFISINLAALAVLWYQGFRPQSWFHYRPARSATLKRIIALVIAISVISLFLAGVTYSSYQSATIKESITTDVETALAQNEYNELRLIDVTIETQSAFILRRQPFTREPTAVIVTVSRPPGEEFPELIGDLDSAIEYDVPIIVRFMDTLVHTPNTPDR